MDDCSSFTWLSKSQPPAEKVLCILSPPSEAAASGLYEGNAEVHRMVQQPQASWLGQMPGCCVRHPVSSRHRSSQLTQTQLQDQALKVSAIFSWFSRSRCPVRCMRNGLAGAEFNVISTDRSTFQSSGLFLQLCL